MTIIRIATRKSPLARWQADFIGQLLIHHHPHLRYELVPMSTTGDQFLKDKLQAIGGKGLFVKELEEALLRNEADIAVHSMKDVPSEFPTGLTLHTICRRDNPHDVLVSQHATSLDDLPTAALIGTSSLRRQSQLLAYRPDLVIKMLRGNIHTRLAKLEQEGFAAILLAAAGLERMGLNHHITQELSTDILLPACGQGALGIECRIDDSLSQSLLAPLNDALTATCINAERQVNFLLGGNCHVPIAVYCEPIAYQQLRLRAKVLHANGQQCVMDEQIGIIDSALELAELCAARLIEKGAHDLLSQ